jgi:dTDP-4-dehydrorhamnose reductase
VSTRVLLLGGSGLLGSAVRASVPPGVTLDAPTRAQLDVTSQDFVAHTIAESDADWIVNCAAYTAVDAAEQHVDEARVLNADLPAWIGRYAQHVGARVLHVSTDYVFDGASTTPWRETDECGPRTVYGRTKHDGEERLMASGADALIVRTAWLYGRVGRSFPRTMWERARAGQTSRVVNDQHGAPTFADDLASWCWALIARDARGIVHASNSGSTTWYDVARYVYARAGMPDGVTAVTSAEFAAPAPRPRYSVLDGSRLDSLLPMPRRTWQAALDEYLNFLDGAE